MSDGENNSPEEFTAAIKAESQRIGFELCGVAPAISPAGFHQLCDWLDAGYAGQMAYLERRREAYAHPQAVLAGVRSVVMLGLNYRTETAHPRESGQGRISRYAWGNTDYHTLIRERLRELIDFVTDRQPQAKCRGVVDTAPLLERDFARLAGLGWFGKNTLLINRRQGSWLFLAALLTDIELAYDEPHDSSHCGTCTRCLEACPTGAFVGPYVLDARKCISYLTIEHRGVIPREMRAGMENWVFGCDVCQDVCPWNRKAPRSSVVEFVPRPDRVPADVEAWLTLSDAEFREEFAQSPLLRAGRAGLLRNAAIVLGNQRCTAAVPRLIAALRDVAPEVRGAAAWALGAIGDAAAREGLRNQLLIESDPIVREELELALNQTAS